MTAAGESEVLLARIMRRMNEGGGFPALDHSVAQIVEALEVGEVDTMPLVNAVLADVSLTQKVLRLANSAMYAPIGRNVSTVSHAMHVLGFEAVGHLALGVKLIGSLGQMVPTSRSAELELAHSLVAGSVAGSVVAASGMVNGEMGVVCTLLHRTGRLLTAFYLPEEWTRIQHAVEAGQDEAEAARGVLGMNLDELGMRIAQQWRLPAKIVHTMQTDAPGVVAEGNTGSEEDHWLLALTRFSDRSAGYIAAGDKEAANRLLEALAVEFGPALSIPSAQLLDAVAAATDGVTDEPFLAGILVEKRGSTAPSVSAADPLALLRAGVGDVKQAVADHESVADIERMILEIAFRTLALARAAIFRLDADGKAYRVSTTLAAREPNRLVRFAMPVEPAADLAHLAMLRKVDIYIDNPRDTKIASRLPDWVRSFGLHPFFLLPMAGGDGKPIGLFYGQQGDDAKLSKEVLGQLAALREQLQDRLRVELRT
jgi:HD-like signal output (HDOD) protein